MKKLLGTVLCMIFMMTACGIKETSSSVQSFEEDSPEKQNHLISYYEAIQLKEALDTSLQNEVFEKEGFPNGYEVSVHHEAKEAVLSIRPASEKNYPSLEDMLEKSMKMALAENKYSEYTVKILPLWNETNQTTRQFHEEKTINDVVNDMNRLHQINVAPDIHFSETDGRIVSLHLTFLANGVEVTEPHQINQYHQEFIRLAEEKGLKVEEISIHVVHNGNEEWKTKVIPAVKRGLKEMDELPVTSATIFTESGPIMINTSLHSTDEQAKEVGKRIETAVTEFFAYPPIKESFPNPITLQVLSEDHQIINE